MADRGRQVKVRATAGAGGRSPTPPNPPPALHHRPQPTITFGFADEEVSHGAGFVLNHESGLDRLPEELGPDRPGPPGSDGQGSRVWMRPAHSRCGASARTPRETRARPGSVVPAR